MGLEIAADDYVTKPFSNRETAGPRARRLAGAYHGQAGRDRGVARRQAPRLPFRGWEFNAWARHLTNPQVRGWR